ncbi:hypothetical protein BGW39_002307 [Mortierella sp. 14UC]|nr:hypothetical protein BGW39_002307 [Mortierella sp. 14UC]
MKSSCQRVFEIPELVLQITVLIDKKTLTTFMATCRLIHNACEPFLYNTLDVYHRPFVSPRIRTLASLTALARNSRLVHHLKTGLVFTAYLCEATMAYLEAQKLNVKDSSSSPSPSQPTRPLWLLPVGYPCFCVPLPPLTNLTTLSGSFDRTLEDDDEDQDEDQDEGQDEEGNDKLAMPIPRDSRTCLAQMCWLVGQSPWLSTLTLTHYWIFGKEDIQLLATAIAGATALERLTLELSVINYSNLSPLLRQAVFCCASTSLQQLCLEELGPITSVSGQEVGLLRRYRGARIYDDKVELEPYRRQAPLPNLVELHFVGDFDFDTPESIRLMLDHCPALESWVVPNIKNSTDAESLARYVAKHCRQIRKLATNQHSRSTSTNIAFISTLMDALPEHSLESLCFTKFQEQQPEAGSARLFQRHSLTMRKIELMNCVGIEGMTVQTILQECRALESLVVWNTASVTSIGITLEGAVAAMPWACTGIKKLCLVVKIHDLYRTAGTNGEYRQDELRPYYERAASIHLTDFEKTQFSLLERLYRQIGQLAELEFLGIKSEVIPEGIATNNVVWGRGANSGKVFPAMLSVGDEETGRLGFLDLFEGLTKLRTLVGSVEVGDWENSGIVGLKEARWFAEHLPCLEEVHFYRVFTPFSVPTLPPALQWLKEQRPGLRMWRSFSSLSNLY